jgi:murein DD-endopeptidase MepM/ murein hydrolase activator NlpD
MQKTNDMKPKRPSISPTWLGYLGLLGFFEFVYSPLRWFYLFFLFWLAAVAWELFGIFGRRRVDTDEPVGFDAKTAGTGAAGLVTFQLLAILGTSPLNPFGFVQSLAHLGGQLIAYLRLRGHLPTPESYRQRTSLTLPVRGCWTVVNGGIGEKTSHSWEILNQRYAYDLVMTDSQGRSYRGEGKRLEDYYAFAQPIVAPAAGEVIRVRDGVRDYPYPGGGRIDWRTRDFRGNFVVLRHAEREYSFLAHLKCGSVRVKAGERVARGDVIGLCGNSGHSTEPHLHVHLQDHPNFFVAVGLPVKFAHVSTGSTESLAHEARYLSAGERVGGCDDAG